MKRLSFYFKEAFITNMYFVIFALIDLGILCIDDSAMTLKIVLCAIDLLGFMFIIGLMFFKEGETAAKVRRGNDLNREQIVRTGREYPINVAEEYKWWKGFFIGLCSCLPLILMMIIHFLLGIGDKPNDAAGGLAALLYIVVFSFLMVNSKVKLVHSQYYFTLLAIPATVLAIGVGYILGARKAEKDYAKIRERHRAIHGDSV